MATVYAQFDSGGNILAIFRDPQPAVRPSLVSISESDPRVAAFEAAQAVPQTVTQGQFMQAVAQLGIGGTTAAQVLAFAQTGALPTFMQTAIAALPANEQAIYQARMTLDATFSLSSPVMQGIAVAAGITQQQLAQIFTLAATL